jgi:hypothetical protein
VVFLPTLIFVVILGNQLCLNLFSGGGRVRGGRRRGGREGVRGGGTKEKSRGNICIFLTSFLQGAKNKTEFESLCKL